MGSEPVAEARHLTGRFLAEIQDVHGVSVSDRALDVVELVVSELVTNTRKYAPGPSRLMLEVRDGHTKATVWADSNPNPPAVLPPDPLRVGQQGLAIVMAVTRAFGVRREPAGKQMIASIVLTDGWRTRHEQVDMSPRVGTGVQAQPGVACAGGGRRARPNMLRSRAFRSPMWPSRGP
ncbi:hypothetical protein ACWGHM_42495 [Streptomyces sp. NPDC054904]